MNPLQIILTYQMTEDESKAYKLTCIYESLLRKILPNCRHGFSHKGDPRKKEIFKYCWKLLRETDGKIDKSDYKLYIYAQLSILKHIFETKNIPLLISPNCLVGKKAWNRWLLWKDRYDRIKGIKKTEINITEQDVIIELKKTKEFLFTKFKKYDKNDIIDTLNSRTLLRWVILGQISKRYPFLSPTVQEWLKNKNLSIKNYFGIGIEVYSEISQKVREFFRSEFDYEF